MPGYARNPDAIEDDLYVFVDESARDASLPSPITGTLVYISSLDEYQYYDGSAWAALGGATVAYQTTAPTDPEIGALWIDSDEEAAVLNSNDFLLKTDASNSYLTQSSASVIYATKEELGGAGINPFFLPGL